MTQEARPALSLQTGIFAVEPTQQGYPVWSRNIDTLDLDCAAVRPDRVVQLLTTSMDYDPWYDASGPLDWKELHLERRTHRLSLRHESDTWKLNRLRLGRLCSSTTRHGEDSHGRKHGLFLAELRSDQLVPHPQRRWAFRPRRRVLANFTDLGLLLKAGRTSGVLWVTRLSTGAPVRGARVAIYRPDGKLVHRSGTDARGIAVLPGTSALVASKPDEQDDDYEAMRRQRLIAVVEHEGGMAVVDGNWANGIQLWNFRCAGRPYGRCSASAHLHSIRPRYLPSG